MQGEWVWKLQYLLKINEGSFVHVHVSKLKPGRRLGMHLVMRLWGGFK